MTATQVPLVRLGHWPIPINDDVSMLDMCQCICGAIWAKVCSEPFAVWFMIHEQPSVCAGSNAIEHVERTDGDGVLECLVCRRWACTHPMPGDPGRVTVDAHPARRAPHTHTAGAVL